MTRRSIERDCAKSLPDAKPDSIRLNNLEFSGRRSVRQRLCQEAASLVCPNGYAPDKRGSPPRSSPCCLLVSAPASAGNPIASNFKKLTPSPPTTCPIPISDSTPAPCYPSNRKDPMTKRISDKQLNTAS